MGLPSASARGAFDWRMAASFEAEAAPVSASPLQQPVHEGLRAAVVVALQDSRWRREPEPLEFLRVTAGAGIWLACCAENDVVGRSAARPHRL